MSRYQSFLYSVAPTILTFIRHPACKVISGLFALALFVNVIEPQSNTDVTPPKLANKASALAQSATKTETDAANKNAEKTSDLETPEQLRVIYQPIHTPEDIVDLTSSEVQPIAYTQVVSLGQLTISTKKQKFIDMLMPAILLSKKRLAEKHQRVESLNASINTGDELSAEDQNWLNDQLSEFKADNAQALLSKLHSHPNSIVLAQAALETGWGTSRFFLEANNVFGVWSFSEKEPRVAASQSRDGTTIYVKKYGSLIEAVDDYFRVIAKGTPYSRFREARLTNQNPIELVAYLDKYSEIGDEYVKRLRSVINHNDMQRYDDYQLDLPPSLKALIPATQTVAQN